MRQLRFHSFGRTSIGAASDLCARFRFLLRSLPSGHYTAFCKNLINGRWYNLDDSSATPISDPESVKTQAAYVLFYRRRGAKFGNL